MKKYVLATALISTTIFALPAFAEKGHIADDVFVFMHGGPSNQYRISGRVHSGSPIDILKKSNDGKYIQVRTSAGSVGWVDANNIENGDSIQIRMPKLESALESSQTLVKQQSTEIQSLTSELDTFKAENGTYSDQLSKLNTDIEELNRQIDNMDESNLMRWFTYGGLVALGGVFLGLLLPYMPKKKKRRDDWL
ncbi:TIGR04211 family SH3 domain-containing protein [Neptunomonas antarctica]|uniref:SH3 domain protein n=1 Tax=Neptunomonas antarctica TaxID=619304 RepID=A0A1N7NPD5_9GAMM|nr:TIGR04211 family SH3 domain-containing protein [Neptunomonas antarctica]SIT00186.1 SH3 domain protein [Neptunomonas antarctica]